MRRSKSLALAIPSLTITIALSTTPAPAFTTPFSFHCTGNACRAVSFLDEGNGCTVATNYGHGGVHITQGANQLSYDLAPGETKAPLLGVGCYGYYDGGETATYLGR